MYKDLDMARIYCKWSEPIAVKRARLSVTDPWYPNRVRAFCCFGAVAATVYVVWNALAPFLHRNPSRNYWSAMLFAAVAAGSIFGLFGPWIFSFVESQIVVSSRGINRNSLFLGLGGYSSLRAEFWPWNSIGRLAIEALPLGRRQFQVLAIYDSAGNRVTTIGLEAKTSKSDLKKIADEQSILLD
jgi:hypothetical protein